MTHVRKESNDKNGFPGGLKLSWAALAVLISAGGLAFVVSNVVHSQSVDAVEKLDKKITMRFDKLDEKLNASINTVTAHCADAHAHERQEVHHDNPE